MADFGIKILKKNAPQSNNKLKDFFLDSEKLLLKIHKRGSFKGTFRGDPIFGWTIAPSIRFDDLGYRPFVIVYCQRIKHDGTVDTNYHLLDWSFHGATVFGEQFAQVFNNKVVINYSDTSVGTVPATDLYGYYYIFKEEVNG